eukprot:4735831-Prymnesium_polylepis.1
MSNLGCARCGAKPCARRSLLPRVPWPARRNGTTPCSAPLSLDLAARMALGAALPPHYGRR